EIFESSSGLRVSCPRAWQVHVRWKSGGAVPREATGSHQVVAVRTLPRGTILDSADLKIEDSFKTAKGMSSIEDAVGSRLRRALSAGDIVTTAVLDVAPTVVRRDVIDIVSTGPGFTVSMAGTARQDGARGARITVRNASSGRDIKGFVDDAGKVSVRR
ncbi:MAG: flagellar basal body P-ring formation chaperone FlgA, partial [Pacificimonas sp.]